MTLFLGVDSGHYTAYAKHVVNNKWYYYNDERCVEQTPHDDDYKNAYVLFYQCKGMFLRCQDSWDPWGVKIHGINFH